MFFTDGDKIKNKLLRLGYSWYRYLEKIIIEK